MHNSDISPWAKEQVENLFLRFDKVLIHSTCSGASFACQSNHILSPGDPPTDNLRPRRKITQNHLFCVVLIS
jgi:hypothetical protein